MFCALEEECTRFKKKKTKKGKTYRGQKWIGRDERVSEDI